MSRTFLLVSVVSVVLASAPFRATAQSYPSKPVRVIVASPAGNVSDSVMRAAAQELAARLAQPVIVENRVGANEIIAQEACARAAPDGYTLCMISKDGMSYNPHTYARLPYDPDKDYKAVTQLFFMTSTLTATASLPVNSVKELSVLAAEKPGSLNFGTRGVGSNQDVFRQWLGIRWKTGLVGIPYKGNNFVLNALAAGEIHLTLGSLGSVVPLAQGGKTKLLAVESSKRFAQLPEVPTFAEAGFEAWPGRPFWGVAVPAGTPAGIVSRLNAELVQLSREPKFMQVLEKQYLELAVGTPEEFAAFLKMDRERIGVLVRQFNIPRQ
jgi:tripartite-type tricarboxylate transporter receptor subunit TctC